MNKFLCEPLVKAGQASSEGIGWPDYNYSFTQWRLSQILIR